MEEGSCLLWQKNIMHKLSVVMITRNADVLLDRCLASVQSIADEVVAVDAGSTDRTIPILSAAGARIIRTRSNHLGRNKARGIAEATHPLILLLDSDEILSPLLVRSIRRVKRSKTISNGYHIRFHNHYRDKRLRYGGEHYVMVRLFRRNKLRFRANSVHEHVETPHHDVPMLSGHINHYSYRSISQMVAKFTQYALLESRAKYRAGEHSSAKKILLYPVHMFWARFIKDKGYRDGLWRLPLDIGFAYMEWLTYTSLALRGMK